MSYLKTLDEKQLNKLHHLVGACKEAGITNKFTQAGIVSVVSKETNLRPKSETGYSNTPNDRIRSIFGSRVSGYSEEQLTNLKASDEKFFNVVYGGMYGNTDPGDGYKYRGQGDNQITFKANFEALKNSTGIDLVKYPELANSQIEGSKICVSYFINRFKKMPNTTKKIYAVNDINGFEDLLTAVRCVYHANAGWGKTIDMINADKTGGLKKALSRCEELYNLIAGE